MSINFWWKSRNTWSCSFTFSEIFWDMLIWVSSGWTCTKIYTQNIYIIRNNNDAIWVDIAPEGVLLFRFFQNSCGSSISYFIAWNRTKFYIQYTYFERWYWYNFPEHSLLGTAIVIIFAEFLEKYRSCVLLNEINQIFICKTYIIRNNNYTF